jgi:large subunit ribosomal protein L6
MSRLGKKPIVVPDSTEISFTDGLLTVKGPKGELKREFKKDIAINVVGKEITLIPKDDSGETNALWGTYSSHIRNMIEGVNEGYQKKLILEGVGYKSEVQGNKMVMALGFSHPVHVEIPAGLKVTAEKNLITVSGIDKELVGQFSAELRSNKKPEPYKGKGMRYEKEVIRRKQGKKTA